jgi:hypothetical protein
MPLYKNTEKSADIILGENVKKRRRKDKEKIYVKG